MVNQLADPKPNIKLPKSETNYLLKCEESIEKERKKGKKQLYNIEYLWLKMVKSGKITYKTKKGQKINSVYFVWHIAYSNNCDNLRLVFSESQPLTVK